MYDRKAHAGWRRGPRHIPVDFVAQERSAATASVPDGFQDAHSRVCRPTHFTVHSTSNPMERAMKKTTSKNDKKNVVIRTAIKAGKIF